MRQQSLINLFLYIAIGSFIYGIFICSTILLYQFRLVDYQILKDLGKNWSEGLITEVVIRNTACSGEYENILKDSYPGTVPGCTCSNFPVERGSCNLNDDEENYEMFSNDCKEVDLTPQVKYQKWRGHFICAKRQNVNYFALTTTPPLSNCPENKPKSCGKLDSLGNIYCVEKNTTCPINQISFMDLTNKLPMDKK